MSSIFLLIERSYWQMAGHIPGTVEIQALILEFERSKLKLVEAGL
jgi:hypothetical protein